MLPTTILVVIIVIAVVVTSIMERIKAAPVAVAVRAVPPKCFPSPRAQLTIILTVALPSRAVVAVTRAEEEGV